MNVVMIACCSVITTLVFSIKASAQNTDKKQIEDSLLLAARKNIEAFRKGAAAIAFTDSSGKPLSGVKLEVNQQTQDFLFGNLSEEMFDPRLTEADKIKFAQRFTALFNFTELTVKWTGYEKQQGKPEWQQLQQKLDWCSQNHITAKGHNIGWTNMSGTPKWLLQLSHEMATTLYQARVYDMVGGFKKQINMWDIVNEPVTTVPWEKALEDSVFGESKIDAGSRYNAKDITVDEIVPWVEKSCKWAHQANADGDFIVNEFYLIARPFIRQKFYELIKILLERRAPVTGIGIQAHEPRDMWFSPIDIVATFNKFDSLQLPLHITEFIPQSSGKKITGGWREGTWTEAAQAEFATQFYTLAFGHPSMASIHWWGLTDKMIWLKGGGLLDVDLNPKPVYTTLMKLIKNDWMTKNLSLITNSEGQVSFRGFFGQYEVVAVAPNGKRKVAHAHLLEGGNNKWVFTL